MASHTLIESPVRDGSWWLWSDGTRLPVVSGGDGPEDPPADPPADPPPADPPADPPPADPPADPPPDPEADLGEAGKRALAAEREARKAAERKAKATEAELAKIKEANKSEQEKAIDAARAEGRTESNTRILKAELKAAAGGRLLNPGDAAKFIDLADLGEVDEAGNVDEAKIKSAIDTLLEQKPYLAATAQKPNPGNPDGGGRGGNGAQLTREDLKSMTPEQIEQARVDGKLASLLGGK